MHTAHTRVQNVTTIDATTIVGLGTASTSLKYQLPLFGRYHADIPKCFPGTINLELYEPLLIQHPTIETPPMQWAPPPRPQEKFGIEEITFEFPKGGQMYQAWLYIPHLSPHFLILDHVEIIAARISNLKMGMPCRVHIPRPHQLRRIIVI